MEESWKDIEGYDGMYQVSDTGKIRSWKCKDGMKWKRSNKATILKLHADKDGYLHTTLSHKGNQQLVYVHRLVGKYFVPNPEGKPCINHKDGDKANNKSSNIEWVTISENTQHAFDNGLIKKAQGEGHGNSKLTEEQVLEIREMKGEKTYEEIGEIYGVHRENIGLIMRREAWTHI